MTGPPPGGWPALLAEQGRVNEAITVLRVRADTDEVFAADRLADLLAGQGCVHELRTRSDAGDGFAARRLAESMPEKTFQEQTPVVPSVASVTDPSEAGEIPENHPES